MSNDDERLASVMDSIYEKAKAYKASGKPYPPWLDKQIKAVHLFPLNVDRAMLMLLDGMQDEQEYLVTLEGDNGGPIEKL